MATPHTPKFTADLLLSYSEGALFNAKQLLVEAFLLLDHDHNARAYFLAVACIEEAGKALLAFDPQKRNLSDPAVCTKLKAKMESHEQKITYAIGIWAMNSSEPRGAVVVALDLIFHLQSGREPSMYSDLRINPDRVETPPEVVRASAAKDCVRLAENALAYADRHVKERVPLQFTPDQDKLFTMKSGKFQEMLNNADFWWYYLSRLEAGKLDIAEVVYGYERDYIKTGVLFRVEQ